MGYIRMGRSDIDVEVLIEGCCKIIVLKYWHDSYYLEDIGKAPVVILRAQIFHLRICLEVIRLAILLLTCEENLIARFVML